MKSKAQARQKIHYRIRKRVSGTAQKPRMNVFRSNKEIYVQLIDDESSRTLAFASSREKDLAGKKANKTEMGKLVGQAIAKKSEELGIKEVVFDRNGYLYHGRVKALADGAREGGLKF